MAVDHQALGLKPNLSPYLTKIVIQIVSISISISISLTPHANPNLNPNGEASPHPNLDHTNRHFATEALLRNGPSGM